MVSSFELFKEAPRKKQDHMGIAICVHVCVSSDGQRRYKSLLQNPVMMVTTMMEMILL